LVGVLAKDRTFARCVLRLLRFEIDNHPLYDYAAESIKERGKRLTYTNLIKMLANGEAIDQEDNYGDDYKLKSQFTVKYADGTTLTRSISEVDIWTLPRIIDELNIEVDFGNAKKKKRYIRNK
jgi:hypothetical protein